MVLTASEAALLKGNANYYQDQMTVLFVKDQVSNIYH
jgi:hypothetical protein